MEIQFIFFFLFPLFSDKKLKPFKYPRETIYKNQKKNI